MTTEKWIVDEALASLDDERPTEVDKDTLDKFIDTFSLHDPVIQRHRLAIYERMRERCPVVRSEAHGGYYSVSTYRDIYDLTHRPEEFSSFPLTIPPLGNPVQMIPIESDPPAHAKYRALVGRQFSPKTVAALSESVTEIVTELLDNIQGRTEVDLAKEVALELPLRVILDFFIGAPRDDWQMLHDVSIVMLQPDPNDSEEQKHEKAAAAGLQLESYFAGLLRQLRENGFGTDLISDLAQSQVDGEMLTDDEIVGFCLLLLSAGYDTTASAISRMFQLFATDHEIRDQVRAAVNDSKRLDVAVDELIRYISPVPGLARNVNEACEHAGTDLVAGDRLLLLWPAANRDPDEFPNPDTFVVDRKPNRHLGFGSGIHRCLGAHIARKEIKILIEQFFARMSDYRLDPDKEPLWHTGDTWGVKSLPVLFESIH